MLATMSRRCKSLNASSLCRVSWDYVPDGPSFFGPIQLVSSEVRPQEVKARPVPSSQQSHHWVGPSSSTPTQGVTASDSSVIPGIPSPWQPVLWVPPQKEKGAQLRGALGTQDFRFPNPLLFTCESGWPAADTSLLRLNGPGSVPCATWDYARDVLSISAFDSLGLGQNASGPCLKPPPPPQTSDVSDSIRGRECTRFPKHTAVPVHRAASAYAAATPSPGISSQAAGAMCLMTWTRARLQSPLLSTSQGTEAKNNTLPPGELLP